jgi:hypothetical protein
VEAGHIKCLLPGGGLPEHGRSRDQGAELDDAATRDRVVVDHDDVDQRVPVGFAHGFDETLSHRDEFL